MVRVALCCLLAVAGWAQTHRAQLQPYERYLIRAAVAGQVVAADESMEGKRADGRAVVRLDDRVDRAQLVSLESTLKSLRKSLELTEEMAKNQQGVYRRQKRYYERIKGLKTKSKTEKDKVFASQASALNQWLSLDDKAAALRRQIADTRYRIALLKDRIDKKRIRPIEGAVVYKVAVRRGDYVNPGTLLMTAVDLSKGRLVLYLDSAEARRAKEATVYIDGKATNLKVSKLIPVADETHLASYRAEIVVPRPPGGLFSKLVTVELK
ncbi:MAG: hypothetical protein GXO33_07805 [Epsilonproteobacteria bacterium]|nr:hypothetical protein [Campylobacterota bacterium]